MLHRIPHHSTKYISLDTRLCQACWKCVETCPNGVLDKVNLPFHKHARISWPDNCKGCQKCVRVCPEKAITLSQTNIHHNKEIA
ncbi:MULTISPECIES: DUF362 domain-containing protein [Dehalococcoides]|uniref:4Fe-4S ferredoxin n=2 Tax=root TaxID=1 RepID=A0AB33HSF4_9CHLR|nr:MULTISPECIES: 4Fe-4S binding protein [Dehalococcoides]MEA4878799.1 4Fe-4S binding protein [Dehalococcoides mccartyi]POZ59389.1 iron-sulfur cluster-binding protein [Dehalococcoides mccartyi]BAZ98005.1 4Fe-4S ferredoxin [Dehalococcoides mccartyi]